MLKDCEAAFAPPVFNTHAAHCFFYGESLIGAIALLLHLRDKGSGAMTRCSTTPFAGSALGSCPSSHSSTSFGQQCNVVSHLHHRDIPDRSFKVPWKASRVPP
ncbi:Os02g0730751, partial [Oryza sativa Japonica Group]